MIALSVLQSTQHDEHHTDERGVEGGGECFGPHMNRWEH